VIALRANRLGDGLGDLGKERMGEVRQQEPYGEGLARDQDACDPVGLVVEFFSALQNSLPGGGLMLPCLRRTLETVTTETFRPLAMSCIVTGIVGRAYHANFQPENDRDKRLPWILSRLALFLNRLSLTLSLTTSPVLQQTSRRFAVARGLHNRFFAWDRFRGGRRRASRDARDILDATDVGSSGKLVSTRDPRQVQLGLKLYF
jgi:hypothetical protein